MNAKKAKAQAKPSVEHSAPKVAPGPKGGVRKAMSMESAYEGQAYDVMLHAWLGQFTGYLSPASISMAMLDCIVHMMMCPAKQANSLRKGLENFSNFFVYAASKGGYLPEYMQLAEIEPRPSDQRFKDEAWQQFPFNLFVQGFLMNECWWNEGTKNIPGATKHHEDMVNFTVRQVLDMFSPSNFPWTNPEVINATIKNNSENLVSGFHNMMEDTFRSIHKLPAVDSGKFQVGENLAVTPGKIVYRNNLIELIQYEPQTKEVYAEPVLIVPAWIMKYYILDLSPENSLVKYLVGKGHTVFMISWKNPTSEDRNLGLEDYVNLGIMESLDAINAIVPNQKIHATGYCLGGTLLMIAAAAMAGNNDDRLKTITLFAAQVDFRDPGELSLFIDYSQINYLEDVMREKGYLDGSQMSGAFSMLRSNDLIWSRMVHDYLLGKRRPLNDLMTWNQDATRLPARMHSQYLRSLFLNNDLTRGRFEVDKKRIAISDITVPIFCVGTVKDHVSPWRSVYKVQLYTNADFTFVLTNGGHNAGIVSEPGHKGRTYQMYTRKDGEKHISSESWSNRAPKYEGSWWPAWDQWLADASSGKVAPPAMGNTKEGYRVICNAPGAYVLEK